MKFKLEIECDNDAFGLGASDTVAEVQRILGAAITKLEGYQLEAVLRDCNGNRVGEYKLTGKRNR